MKMKLLMTSVLSTSLFLVACGGGSSDDGPATTNPSGTPTNNIQNPVVKVEAYTSTNLGSVAAESSILTYKMLGQSGQEVQATSLVFTPNTQPPVGGWPIVVWAHGTTGVADVCAPSKAALADSTKDLISKLLAAGYVVVAPDYEGLGTPGIHPFLNVKSEAFSITDAVVATRNYLSQRNLLTSKKWVTVGHSQGGHAALGAAQYASRAQLDYKGTVAVAPASNLGSILVDGEAQVANAPIDIKIGTYAQLDTYTALVTAGIRNTQPSFDYGQVFTSQISSIAAQAENLCSGPLYGAFYEGMSNYAKDHNGTLDGFTRTQPNFMAVPLVKTFLDKDSQPLQVKVTTPIIIYQGIADPTVPKLATDLLISNATAVGTKINNYVTGNWDHGTAMSSNVDNIVGNVQSLLAAQ
ncbi:alpha/beta hydrolase [Acinetobacter baumannii]|uniref:Prolyl oligopeptidase family protein n=1 Tax=Acinetobacter baumannii 99063 TaxID=1310630 RepID=A0A009SF05_ACIBA|nr:alpha/beta fold hydrolase [Acinetobacter baumannii]EJB8410057.1 alpha/beta fold hydrolase [Acinetobacter baumannii]EXC52328.1 prolyl oligopeptidase family protein [Acinetobacter baumannii 99063]MBP2808849.1 alpha/beta fold hydrolase [Acinetobacter baumannii]MBU3094267.1 lipase family protein [Acinetobacter baumannii]MCG6640008.1 alpha/beta fold hydrolase [Acinetobacter baumannii]